MSCERLSWAHHLHSQPRCYNLSCDLWTCSTCSGRAVEARSRHFVVLNQFPLSIATWAWRVPFMSPSHWLITASQRGRHSSSGSWPAASPKHFRLAKRCFGSISSQMLLLSLAPVAISAQLTRWASRSFFVETARCLPTFQIVCAAQVPCFLQVHRSHRPDRSRHRKWVWFALEYCQHLILSPTQLLGLELLVLLRRYGRHQSSRARDHHELGTVPITVRLPTTSPRHPVLP